MIVFAISTLRQAAHSSADPRAVSPSSDLVKSPAKKTDRRKKTKRGGPKGPQGKLREPLPPERVDEEITYEINAAVTVHELRGSEPLMSTNRR